MQTFYADDNHGTLVGTCGGPLLPDGTVGRVGKFRDGGGGRGDVSSDRPGGGVMTERGVEGGDGKSSLCWSGVH